MVHGARRLFLDTTVLISGVLKRNPQSWRLLNLGSPELVTSAFAVKEMRRVLKALGYDAETVNALVDFVKERCRVARAPRKEEFRKYRLRDRSDAPMVASAVKERCEVLVTEDAVLREDAGRYIESASPAEVLGGP
jgi:predicted nucleic acid-binding protein